MTYLGDHSVRVRQAHAYVGAAEIRGALVAVPAQLPVRLEFLLPQHAHVPDGREHYDHQGKS